MLGPLVVALRDVGKKQERRESRIETQGISYLRSVCKQVRTEIAFKSPWFHLLFRLSRSPSFR